MEGRFYVSAYDEAFAGYGDSRALDFGTEEEAVAYARSIHKNPKPTVWQLVKLQPLYTKIPY